MKRILLVDDEPHIIRIMKLGLERAGYTVDVAANGLQALGYLQRCRPDILITDIDMPQMSGKDLCIRIEEEMPDRTFRIVVVTSRAEDEHRVWSGSMDKLTFMEKPISISKLLSGIREDHTESGTGGEEPCLTAR